MVLDVPPEDVADADVLQVEGLGQQFGLRALPTALDAHDDVLAHLATRLPRTGPSASLPCQSNPSGQRAAIRQLTWLALLGRTRPTGRCYAGVVGRGDEERTERRGHAADQVRALVPAG